MKLLCQFIVVYESKEGKNTCAPSRDMICVEKHHCLFIIEFFKRLPFLFMHLFDIPLSVVFYEIL